jgi:hypothetical protein
MRRSRRRPALGCFGCDVYHVETTTTMTIDVSERRLNMTELSQYLVGVMTPRDQNTKKEANFSLYHFPGLGTLGRIKIQISETGLCVATYDVNRFSNLRVRFDFWFYRYDGRPIILTDPVFSLPHNDFAGPGLTLEKKPDRSWNEIVENFPSIYTVKILPDGRRF